MWSEPKVSFRTLSAGAGADALSNADADSASTTAREKARADAQAASAAAMSDPFGNRFAVVQLGLLVGRPEVGHGLVISVGADAAESLTLPRKQRRGFADLLAGLQSAPGRVRPVYPAIPVKPSCA